MKVSKDTDVRAFGFTLVEAIVAIGIVALLGALLIPAVQSARSAARKIQCSSNLHQMGLAMANYESAVGSFPMAANANRGYSVFSMILLTTEHVNMYNSINYSIDPLDRQNSTASANALGFLMCPADSNGGFGKSYSNYAASVGYGFQLNGPFNGIFPIKPLMTPRMADVSDGASNTAMISEWLTGSDDLNGIPELRKVFRTSAQFSKESEFVYFNTLCAQISDVTSAGFWNHKGRHWIASSLGNTLYNHNLPPNKSSCLNGSLVREGSWTASSFHGSGVNVLYADGHVRLIKSSIDISVWRAIGTRGGGESFAFPD